MDTMGFTESLGRTELDISLVPPRGIPWQNMATNIQQLQGNVIEQKNVGKDS